MATDDDPASAPGPDNSQRPRRARSQFTCQTAREADIDHLDDWNHGGHTSATNCHPLCPHHHKVKHDGGWTITRTGDGAYHWTSPTGRTYTTQPTALPH